MAVVDRTCLPTWKDLLEKPIQNPACRPGPRRSLVGAFDLPKNLRLAQDHRLQPGSDPEQMPNRGNSLEPEKMLQTR